MQTASATSSSPAAFPRVSRKEYGYDVRQVDAFMARARQEYNSPNTEGTGVRAREVRSVSFEPVKGGYDPRAIDTALDRIEDAFVQRERDQMITTRGEEAWMDEITQISASLRGRLRRRRGERFRRPAKHGVASYNVEDVDRLCEELSAYFDHDQPLSVDAVRRAIFRETKGQAGYEEAQVDAFLDRVVEVMAQIE